MERKVSLFHVPADAGSDAALPSGRSAAAPVQMPTAAELLTAMHRRRTGGACLESPEAQRDDDAASGDDTTAGHRIRQFFAVIGLGIAFLLVSIAIALANAAFSLSRVRIARDGAPTSWRSRTAVAAILTGVVVAAVYFSYRFIERPQVVEAAATLAPETPAVAQPVATASPDPEPSTSIDSLPAPAVVVDTASDVTSPEPAPATAQPAEAPPAADAQTAPSVNAPAIKRTPESRALANLKTSRPSPSVEANAKAPAPVSGNVCDKGTAALGLCELPATAAPSDVGRSPSAQGACTTAAAALGLCTAVAAELERAP